LIISEHKVAINERMGRICYSESADEKIS